MRGIICSLVVPVYVHHMNVRHMTVQDTHTCKAAGCTRTIAVVLLDAGMKSFTIALVR